MEETLLKNNIINYFKFKYPDKEIPSINESIESLWNQTYDFNYQQHQKNEEIIKEKKDRYEHERIKYRKRILKKNNVKSIEGEFLQQLNIFQSLFKHPKGKRIMVLNLFIDSFDINSVMLDYGITIKRGVTEELLIKFDKKVPLMFEMEYFCLNIVNKKKKDVKPQLKLFQDLKKSSERITSNLIEISPKLKKVLK